MTNNFDFLSVRGTAASVVPFATVIWSRHPSRSLSNGEETALCDETKHLLQRRMSVAPMHFIFT